MHRGKKGFTPHYRRGAGFTLIEIILIIVIVAIAIPTLLFMVGQEAKFGVESEVRVTAANVAQALMEEIKTKCWDETAVSGGACTGTVTYSLLQSDGTEDRTACTGAYVTAPYDDIDDYNNYSQNCPVGGVNYFTSVAVCYVPNTNLNDTSTCSTGTDYKRIQVTITAPATNWGSDVKHVTVMTNY